MEKKIIVVVHELKQRVFSALPNRKLFAHWTLRVFTMENSSEVGPSVKINQKKPEIFANLLHFFCAFLPEDHVADGEGAFLQSGANQIVVIVLLRWRVALFVPSTNGSAIVEYSLQNLVKISRS